MILTDVYRAAVEEDFAIPVMMGRKSAAERFPGALETLAIEAMMRDGKALQAGTSPLPGPELRQGLRRAVPRPGGQAGVPLRHVVGRVDAAGRRADHGPRRRQGPSPAAEAGAVPGGDRPDLPGRAERHASWRPSSGSRSRWATSGSRSTTGRSTGPATSSTSGSCAASRCGLRSAPGTSKRGRSMAYRRDTGEKSAIPLTSLPAAVPEILADIQSNLFQSALDFRTDHTFSPGSYDELVDLLKDASGFVQGGWCGNPDCETKVKDQTKATIRVLPLDPAEQEGTCIVCGSPCHRAGDLGPVLLTRRPQDAAIGGTLIRCSTDWRFCFPWGCWSSVSSTASPPTRRWSATSRRPSGSC